MTDPVHSSKGLETPSSGTVNAQHGRDTVLLSDVPDVSTLSPGPASLPTQSSLASHFTTSSLTALSERYDILEEAGHGSMGNVYKARDRETSETVALKLLKPEIASDQAMMERFKNELLFARKITHKNVCRVYEFNRIGGIAYTSMEFVEGESLRSVLNRFGGLPLRKAIDVATQTCSGLKEAHAQGIVHRDLKPENVMIDKHGNVKIMDFGIARSMEAGTRLTGSMVGTPAYMAPEQVAGKPVDYRTDIYSLGLMLYEMFTGKQAFQADTPVAVALKQMREVPAPPHEIEPSVPLEIERAILKCLEKEPAKRFQSIADLEKALHPAVTSGMAATSTGIAAGHSSSHASSPRVTASPPQKTSYTRAPAILWVMLGAFTVLALAAALHWMAVAKTAGKLPAPPQPLAPKPPQFALERPAPAPAKLDAAKPDSPKATIPKSPTPKSTASVHAKPPAATPLKPGPPEVFPRMETGPRTNAVPSPVASTSQAQVPALSSQAHPNGEPTYLWVGRFEREDRAQAAAKRIEDLGLPVAVMPRHLPNGQAWAVFAGPFGTNKAKNVMQLLESKGFPKVHPTNPVGPATPKTAQ